MVKLSQLDDQYQQVFTNLDRGVGDPIPITPDGYQYPVFRNIFNDHFASAEYMITSNAMQETQAVLPPLKQTIEVVGDDTLNLTYDEWVYLVTGFYPKDNKSMSLGSRARKGSLAWTNLITAGADDDAALDAYGKWVARHNFGYNDNLICIEPTFFMFVAGIWETPNSSDLYKPAKPTGGSAPTLRPRKRGSASTSDADGEGKILDRGADFEMNLARNSTSWIADPAELDPLGTLGSGAGERDMLNYWLAGELRMSRDYDPILLKVASDKTLQSVREDDAVDTGTTFSTGEGSEAYLCDLNFHVGVATLQGFL
jgi:hypothetical protein